MRLIYFEKLNEFEARPTRTRGQSRDIVSPDSYLGFMRILTLGGRYA